MFQEVRPLKEDRIMEDELSLPFLLNKKPALCHQLNIIKECYLWKMHPKKGHMTVPPTLFNWHLFW